MKHEKYIVDGKYIDITKEDWKYLIVLDACRYDYFEKNYSKHFNGTLKKAISSTSDTMKWLNENFSGFHPDIAYISTIPFINSVTETKAGGMTYDGKMHFPIIIDCEWSEEFRTVMPETVVSEAISMMKEYPDKRLIIHFLQPHEPYIGENYRKYINKNYTDRAPTEEKKGIRNKIGAVVKKSIDVQIMWKLAKLFKRSTLSPTMLIGMTEGIEGVRNAYEENLNLVLAEVGKLLPMFDGNVLIIGDHGEYLGEHGIYGHDSKKRKKEIWEVPYFTINKRGN